MRNKAASRLDSGALRRVLRRFHADLVAAEQTINDLNVFPVPDGDTGTNCVLTFQTGLPVLDKGRTALPAMLDGLAGALALGARGNSGVILAEYLRGWASLDADGWGPDELHAALAAGATAAQAAVVVPREGTMLTLAQAVAAVPMTETLDEYAVTIAQGARTALAATTEQLDVLKAAGVVDSGAMVLTLLFDALAAEVTGQAMPALPVERRACDVSPVEYTGPAYEVMFTFDGDRRACHSLREELSLLGDSVTVTGQGPFRVHVHVDFPADAVAEGQRHGRVHSIDITRLASSRDQSTTSQNDLLGIVVATNIPGLAQVITDAGAHCLIAGEHAAPSTIEFVDAARATGASRVLLLPSDIDVHASAALAAHQLGIEGVTAQVVGTRSAAESLAALHAFSTHPTHDNAATAMASAAHAVRSAAVAVTSRDSMTAAGMCRTGDVMGLVAGTPVLVSSAATVDDMCLAMVDRLLDDGGSQVTLIVGSDGDPAVEKRILADHPGVKVRVISGGQRATAYQVGVA